MAHLPVKRGTGQWGATWAIFLVLILLGLLVYLGLEAVAPPPDAADTELVGALLRTFSSFIPA